MEERSGVVRRADGMPSCWWADDDAALVDYHDSEWGLPVGGDRGLFALLTLESFHAGLSRSAILDRRPAFREAFAGFDPDLVARFGDADVERLVTDAAIVRHRGKIDAAVTNARAVLEVREELGSFGALIWSFEPQPPARPARIDRHAVEEGRASPEADALSRALRGRGFRYLGPATVYATMQAAGVVNDHVEGCHRRGACEEARAVFPRPGTGLA